MTAVKQLQSVRFPERLARKRSIITAIVCLYCGVMSCLAFVMVPAAFFIAAREGDPDILTMIPNAIIVLIIGVSYFIGAFKISRFDRQGVLWIAMVALITPIQWISKTPSTGAIVSFFVTLIALLIAWYDLDPVGHGG